MREREREGGRGWVRLRFSEQRFLSFFLSLFSRIGVLRTQKVKTHRLRTQSSKVLPLKPGVGQNIAVLASPTARDFLLPGPFTVIFPKPLLSFSCVRPVGIVCCLYFYVNCFNRVVVKKSFVV